MPQPGENIDTALLNFGGLRVLILINHILVERLRHQSFCFWLHPGGDEGGQVEPGIAIEDQFIMDQAISDIGCHFLGREFVTWNTVVQCACRVGWCQYSIWTLIWLYFNFL